MTTAVQRRRGTNTEHASFTGLEGELSVNTTNESVHVHDGSTAGGFELARADASNIVATSIDINGGTIDGTTIGASSASTGAFTTLTASGAFTSLGIDDNATSTAITIDSSENSTFSNSIIFSNSSYSSAYSIRRQADALIFSGGTSGYYFNRSDNSATDLYIDGSGNVGIGNSSPSTRLTVGAGSGTEEIRVDAGAGWADVRLHSDATNGGSIYFNDGADAGQIFYYHPDNTMRFHTNASERMRIDSSGAVGIGTSSPSAPMHVNRSGVGEAIRFTDSSTDTGHLDVVSGGGCSLWAGGFLAFGAGGGGSYTERMRIDSSGRVGIGTSSPSYELDIQSSSGDAEVAITGSTTNNAVLKFENVTSNTLADIYADNSKNLIFRTNSTTERMRIDSSGNLLVGTTDTNVFDNTSGNGIGLRSGGEVQIAVDSGETLYLNRMGTDGRVINFRKAGSFVSGIDVTSTTVTYNTSSDQRLKENIADADDAGSKIDAIQVRKFDWKADGSHQDYGMIAQELQTVAPEAVSGDADSEEMMGVDYSKLVPMLIKEIQSLRNRVAQLEE